MPENANLTDQQRELNRIVWILVEACGRAKVPMNTTGVRAVAKHVCDVLHENDLLLTWLSDFERRVNGGAK